MLLVSTPDTGAVSVSHAGVTVAVICRCLCITEDQASVRRMKRMSPNTGGEEHSREMLSTCKVVTSGPSPDSIGGRRASEGV